MVALTLIVVALVGAWGLLRLLRVLAEARSRTPDRWRLWVIMAWGWVWLLHIAARRWLFPEGLHSLLLWASTAALALLVYLIILFYLLSQPRLDPWEERIGEIGSLEDEEQEDPAP
jgi:membrane protein YdbS with pleckstrin-like domain